MAEKKDTKPTWISTQTEISKAIQGWSDVTEEINVESKVTPKLAPDTQIFKDIEGLIKQIKSKLDEFTTETKDETPPDTNKPEASLS